MDHLDEASTKIKENCFQDHTENQKEDRKESGRTECQENKRRENNEHTLSEEEDDDEGLQNAIEASMRTASQEAIRRQNNGHTLSEEEEYLQQASEDAIYINRVQEELIKLKKEQINIEHIEYVRYQLQQYIILSNKEDKILLKRIIDDYIDVVKEDPKILPSLARLQVEIRASKPLVMSKEKLIKKLKKRFGDPINMTEDCLICCSRTPSDSKDPSDFYKLPCCPNVLHITCIAKAAIKKYYDTAGEWECKKPKYECAFCRKSLFEEFT